MRQKSWRPGPPSLGRQPQRPPVLHRAHPAQRLLRALLVIVAEPRVEAGHELLGGDPAPVPAVEELALEPAEEPLARRVVRRAPLRRHRAREPVLLAYRDPAGPAVVPAAVGVDPGRLARRQRRAGAREARVRQLRVGRGGDRPRRQAAVEAVQHGREVDLGLPRGRQAELGDVGEPQEVRQAGAEVARDQVGRRVGHLPGVAAPPPRTPEPRDLEPLLAHEAAHGPLAARDAAGREPHAQVAVAARAADGLELLGERRPRLGPPVRGRRGPPRVVVARRRDREPRCQRAQGIRPPERVDERRLLPVRQRGGVGAWVFFYELDHLAHEVVLHPELAHHALELLRVVRQRPRRARRPLRDVPHEGGSPLLRPGPPPVEDRRPRDAEVLRDPRGLLAGEHAEDGALLLVRVQSYRGLARARGLAPPPDPPGERGVARVAELPDGRADVAQPVVGLERRLPLLPGIQGFSSPPGLQDFCRTPGYQSNPFPFFRKADVFLCTSTAEGFSTTASEAAVLGLPVFTTNCAGMDELASIYDAVTICDNSTAAVVDMVLNAVRNRGYEAKAGYAADYFNLEKRIQVIEKLIDGTVDAE